MPKHYGEEMECGHCLLPAKLSMSQCVQMICVPDAKKGDDGSVAALVHSPARMGPFRLTLGNDRSRGLALANKASAQAQASNDQNKRERDFFHNVPLFVDIKGSICAFEQLVQERHSGWIAAAQSLCKIPDIIIGWFWQSGPRTTLPAALLATARRPPSSPIATRASKSVMFCGYWERGARSTDFLRRRWSPWSTPQ